MATASAGSPICICTSASDLNAASASATAREACRNASRASGRRPAATWSAPAIIQASKVAARYRLSAICSSPARRLASASAMRRSTGARTSVAVWARRRGAGRAQREHQQAGDARKQRTASLGFGRSNRPPARTIRGNCTRSAGAVEPGAHTARARPRIAMRERSRQRTRNTRALRPYGRRCANAMPSARILPCSRGSRRSRRAPVLGRLVRTAILEGEHAERAVSARYVGVEPDRFGESLAGGDPLHRR